MEKPRVLILDDEPEVLSSVRRVLRNEVWEIMTLTSPAATLKHLAERHWDVLVADYRMPEMDGITVMENAAAISADTVRIMLSGVTDVKVVIDAINRGAVYRVLEKPWDDDVLCITLRQAVELSMLVRDRRRADAEKARTECNRVMLESLGAVCHHFGQPATTLQTSLWLLRKQIPNPTPAVLTLLDECITASEQMGGLLRRLNEINEYRTTPYLPGPGSVDGNHILDIN